MVSALHTGSLLRSRGPALCRPSKADGAISGRRERGRIVSDWLVIVIAIVAVGVIWLPFLGDVDG